MYLSCAFEMDSCITAAKTAFSNDNVTGQVYFCLYLYT